VEVRWTGNRGWGVFTKTFVRKGTYVATYKGEVLSAAAAKERYDAITSRGGNPDYQGACLRASVRACLRACVRGSVSVLSGGWNVDAAVVWA